MIISNLIIKNFYLNLKYFCENIKFLQLRLLTNKLL